VIIFVNFSFALFTPPLGDYQRQLIEWRDKEEEEVLRQLKERREKATGKYLSYFTVDRYQKIICQGDIDMTSFLPPS
jgi:CHAD domain-containing protein